VGKKLDFERDGGGRFSADGVGGVLHIGVNLSVHLSCLPVMSACQSGKWRLVRGGRQKERGISITVFFVDSCICHFIFP